MQTRRDSGGAHLRVARAPARNATGFARSRKSRCPHGPSWPVGASCHLTFTVSGASCEFARREVRDGSKGPPPVVRSSLSLSLSLERVRLSSGRQPTTDPAPSRSGPRYRPLIGVCGRRLSSGRIRSGQKIGDGQHPSELWATRGDLGHHNSAPAIPHATAPSMYRHPLGRPGAVIWGRVRSVTDARSRAAAVAHLAHRSHQRWGELR